MRCNFPNIPSFPSRPTPGYSSESNNHRSKPRRSHVLLPTSSVGGCETTTPTTDASAPSSMLVVETIHLSPRQIQFDRLIPRRTALPRLHPGKYLPLDLEFVPLPRPTTGVGCRRRPQGVFRALQYRGRRGRLRRQGRRRRQRVPRGVDRADAGLDHHVIPIAVRLLRLRCGDCVLCCSS